MAAPKGNKFYKNVKEQTGAPTIYSEDIVKKSIEYIDSCEDEERQIVTGQGDNFTKYETKLKVNIPTIEGLAYHLKIHRDTVRDWKEKHKEFSAVIDTLKQKQAGRLIAMGLSGEYNSTIVKLMLNKHGYSDRQEIDHTSKGEKINNEPPSIIVMNTNIPMAGDEKEVDTNRSDV